MCAGSCLKTIFTLALLVGFILTLLTLLTPSLRRYSLKDAKDSFKRKDYSFGLITKICGQNEQGKQGEDFLYMCLDKFDQKETWEKVALACLIAAVAAEFLTIFWMCAMCLTCSCCCFDSCLVPPLPILTGIATILLAVGITVYGVKSEEKFDITNFPTSTQILDGLSDFGYSMWLGIAAIAVMLLDTTLGIALVHVYEKK